MLPQETHREIKLVQNQTTDQISKISHATECKSVNT